MRCYFMCLNDESADAAEAVVCFVVDAYKFCGKGGILRQLDASALLCCLYVFGCQFAFVEVPDGVVHGQQDFVGQEADFFGAVGVLEFEGSYVGTHEKAHDGGQSKVSADVAA